MESLRPSPPAPLPEGEGSSNLWGDITGHKQQLELLSRALGRGKLAHAYVFAGPDGIGKRSIAKKLALELLKTQIAPLPNPPHEGEGITAATFHPDLLEIDGAEGIKIEQIRELAYKLSLKPYQAQNKVALIDEADQMSTEAANALLKVLEEPKNYTYIFLTTSNPYRLPKTILSRCQKINFAAPPERAPLSEGERGPEFERYFQIFDAGNLADRLIAAYELADLESWEIKKHFQSWTMKLEQRLLQTPEKILAQKIKRISKSQKYLDQNVNSKLLLTNLMMS